MALLSTSAMNGATPSESHALSGRLAVTGRFPGVKTHGLLNARVPLGQKPASTVPGSVRNGPLRENGAASAGR
jgi:hypothetical protein